MKKGFVFVITLLSLTLAAVAAPKAAKHNITLAKDTEIGGVQLKAGDYRVTVEDNTATFYRGSKAVAKAGVHAENVSDKITSDSVLFDTDGHVLRELRFAGTSSKLVLDGSATQANGTAGKE